MSIITIIFNNDFCCSIEFSMLFGGIINGFELFALLLTKNGFNWSMFELEEDIGCGLTPGWPCDGGMSDGKGGSWPCKCGGNKCGGNGKLPWPWCGLCCCCCCAAKNAAIWLLIKLLLLKAAIAARCAACSASLICWGVIWTALACSFSLVGV